MLHPHWTEFILLQAEKINTREGRLAHRYGDLGPQLDGSLWAGSCGGGSDWEEEGDRGKRRETGGSHSLSKNTPPMM